MYSIIFVVYPWKRHFFFPSDSPWKTHNNNNNDDDDNNNNNDDNNNHKLLWIAFKLEMYSNDTVAHA